MREFRRVLVLFAVLLCLPVMAACGGGGSPGGGGGDDPDPAEAIPGTVPFYGEVTLRPEGDAADAIETLSAKFGVQDPGQRIVDFLESQGDGESDVSYTEDVEPWLGKRLGIAGDVAEDDPPFLAAVGVRDADKAKAFVDENGKGDAKSYKDVEYKLDDDDTFVGVDGDYLLLSDDEAQFKRMVDQIASGEKSLADSDTYTDAVGDLPDSRIGTFYFAARPLIERIKRDPEFSSSGAGPVLEQTYGSLVSVAGGLTPFDDRAVLEVRTKTDGDSSGASLFNGLADAPGIVKEVPADALAVYGAPDVGPNYKKVLGQFAGAFGGAALQGQLQAQLGIDLDRDVFSWIGDVAVFVRGTSAQDVSGAVMIDALDADAAAAAIPKLIGIARQQGGVAFDPADLNGADQAFQATVPGVPAPIFVARKGTRVVIGVGEDSTTMGLTPSASLDASGGYDRATGVLDGISPSVIVDAQKVVGLIEQAAAGDASFQEAKPYLEPLAQLVVGSRADGDTQVTRVALSVE